MRCRGSRRFSNLPRRDLHYLSLKRWKYLLKEAPSLQEKAIGYSILYLYCFPCFPLSNLPGAQAWRTGFWMGVFGHPSPKRHLIWSNDQGLLETINDKAGYMSREDQQTKDQKLVHSYVDNNGKRRCTGIRSKLKESQRLV